MASTTDMPNTMRKPQTLTRADGPSIAYHHTPGRTPGVMFLSGFRSDMAGTKAVHLEAWARAHGQQFTRFDYRGHGISGGEFHQSTIGEWAADAIAVLDEVTQGPQILVGSSMGGWLALLAALTRPQRIAGMVGIAAAPDFVLRMDAELSDAQRAEMLARGWTQQPSDYGEPLVITRKLIEEGQNHLLLDKPIALTCPIRLLQGQQDASVPWETPLHIAERLTASDVRVTLLKNGDHRLSTDGDLELLCATVEELIKS